MRTRKAVLFGAFVLAASVASADSLSIPPAEVRSADTKVLAERLVRRIHERCDLSGAPDPGGRRPGAFELIMMVPAEALASIRARGFLNQHQTLATQGFSRMAARFEAEQELAMTRLTYGRKGRELLPKYAVLNIRRPDYGSFRLPARYGTVAVVFKKEVEARATWTYADSLDYSRTAGRFDRGGASNPVLARTAAYAGNASDRNVCGNYCEAQIWGRLTWDDVESVMISTSDAFPAALADAGVPVYRYASAPNPAQTAQYVRGERLTPPAVPAPPERGPDPAAVANFLRGEEEARLDDAALARRLAAATDADPERMRLLGELAERPKSEAATAALSATLKTSASAPERALALGGLSELPWERFKPHLLSELRSAEDPVEAVALAAEHRGDADVSAALGALRVPDDGGAGPLREWRNRALTGELCGRLLTIPSTRTPSGGLH